MSLASSHEFTFLLSDLSRDDQQLMESAISAMKTAYAPYSKFTVGAAVRMETGQIVSGSNQENASYPLCMCAERVALYNAAVNLPQQKIVAIAIVAHNEHKPIDKPVTPCGACRQVIAEFENRQSEGIRILLKGDNDKVLMFNDIAPLLPLTFDGSYLLRDQINQGP